MGEQSECRYIEIEVGGCRHIKRYGSGGVHIHMPGRTGMHIHRCTEIEMYREGMQMHREIDRRLEVVVVHINV